MIFALSIHSFVTRIGAYAGFAAVIGLALLAILLFAQARELRHLREWGAHAHARIGELERRLAAALELARRAGASQRTMAPGVRAAAGTHAAAAAGRPVGASPAARGPVPARTSAPTRLPLLPAAPVGVAGAALGSATMLIPLPKRPPGGAPRPATAPAAVRRPEVAQPTVAAPALAAEPATPPAPAPATAAAAHGAAASPAAGAADAAGTPTPAPAPAPAAAPSATNGHSDTFPPVPPVRRPIPPVARAAAARRPPVRGRPRERAGDPVPRPGARPAAAAPLRARGVPSATARGTGAPAGGRGGQGQSTSGSRRRLLPLLAGLAVVALVAIAFAVLSSGGGGSAPGTQSASSTGATPRRGTTHSTAPPAAAAPAHDRITVAVLNGTATAGLANTLATTLTNAGFVKGPIGNASDQQRSVTVVSYFGGHEADAREVAKTLNVPVDAVQPIDANTEAACARSTGSCAVPVVVTVGADRG